MSWRRLLGLKPRGEYHGRLAFDGTDFLDPDGHKLVTDGQGNFRYKETGDAAHNETFASRPVLVQGTTPDDVHHFGPTAVDPHYDAIRETGFAPADPDVDAARATSHTDAYK